MINKLLKLYPESIKDVSHPNIPIDILFQEKNGGYSSDMYLGLSCVSELEF